MTDLSAAYADCEARLRAEDRDAWLAALLAPAAARPHLHAVSAFALELGHVRQRVHQAVAGEIRLQWWQEVVDGLRAGEAASHPVAAALVDTLRRAALPGAPIGDMIDAFRMGLYDEPPADLPALARRLAASHGTPVRLAVRVLGGGPGLDAAADDAGIALGLADLLGDVGDRADLLPEAVLIRHGARRADVTALSATPAVRAALAELRGEAWEHLANLRRRRREFGGAGPAFLGAAIVALRLDRSERAADPLAPLPEVPAWRRQWRLWRAARSGGAV